MQERNLGLTISFVDLLEKVTLILCANVSYLLRVYVFFLLPFINIFSHALWSAWKESAISTFSMNCLQAHQTEQSVGWHLKKRERDKSGLFSCVFLAFCELTRDPRQFRFLGNCTTVRTINDKEKWEETKVKKKTKSIIISKSSSSEIVCVIGLLGWFGCDWIQRRRNEHHLLTVGCDFAHWKHWISLWRGQRHHGREQRTT